MKTLKSSLLLLAVLCAVSCLPLAVIAQAIPDGSAIDAEVGKIMTHTHAKGLAVAVIDHGKVGYVQAYGIRNAKGDPLATDTVMYGASLTKTVFAYTVMQLVDQGKLSFDAPIRDDLDKPLPSYGPIRSSRTSTGQTIAAQQLQVVKLLTHALHRPRRVVAAADEELADHLSVAVAFLVQIYFAVLHAEHAKVG